MTEIECPVCETEFEVYVWDNGECPKCGNEYYWDEACTPDYSDCWATIEWENYSKND